MAQVNVKELIDAGIHFGHRTSRWNPKMAPYIFGKRNLIHIIDLKETVKGLLRSKTFITRVVAKGRDVLFVGTKRQAQATVQQEAERTGMPWVSERWIGGTLTNFDIIRLRLKYLEDLEAMETDGRMEAMSKKMIAHCRREKRKVFRNLSGIRTMTRIPGAIVLVDPIREATAVREARKLDVPLVALADTECNPDDVDILIPGNDDSTRAVEVILGQIADAILEGKANRPARAPEAASDKDGEGRAPARRTPLRRRGARTRAGAEEPAKSSGPSERPERPAPTPPPAPEKAESTTPEPATAPDAKAPKDTETPKDTEAPRNDADAPKTDAPKTDAPKTDAAEAEGKPDNA